MTEELSVAFEKRDESESEERGEEDAQDSDSTAAEQRTASFRFRACFFLRLLRLVRFRRVLTGASPTLTVDFGTYDFAPALSLSCFAMEGVAGGASHPGGPWRIHIVPLTACGSRKKLS
eukprot:CAMPEP_0167785892 /NCGR_PEP_ID=MMETSP0111_2-20121227/8477_1 /TAXON_ID=91324 /ORGANISM="Lotharella globosa, Strain CCCM811" /LENGTH=118 /DNA_ID=CAMNT_0007677189 /DNA_START=304 /DNA_END=660 /DNA_ORIENTATION=-